jgi:hypothetical protein
VSTEGGSVFRPWEDGGTFGVIFSPWARKADLAFVAANDPASVLAACARDRDLLALAVEGLGEHHTRHYCVDQWPSSPRYPCDDARRYQRILDGLAATYPEDTHRTCICNRVTEGATFHSPECDAQREDTDG